MMNKRILAAMVAACILLLSGCQLAQQELQSPTQPDKLIGVVITTEFLDLVDIESYLQDHASELLSGQAPGIDAEYYSDRLYAQATEQTNEGVTTLCYEFPGLEGISFFSFLKGSTQESYWSSVTAGAISDAHILHDARDDGVGLELNGTVYVSSGKEETVFYYNPVYQDAEGRVYLIPGTGMSFSSALAGSASHTLSSRLEYTENGSTALFESEVTITTEAVHPALEVTVIEMDDANTALGSVTYPVEQLPQDYVPGNSCAYLLVVEQTADGVRRTLCQSEESFLTVFSEMDDGICEKLQISVRWPE